MSGYSDVYTDQYLPDPVITLTGNLLSVADSDFETGTTTWAAGQNASGVAISSAWSFSNSRSLAWTTTAGSPGGASSVISGRYPASPGLPYLASGYWYPGNPGDQAQISLNFYDSSGTLIPSLIPPPGVPVFSTTVVPLAGSFTSPAGTASLAVTVTVTPFASGETEYIDLMYLSQAGTQVLIDWYQPVYATDSRAGAYFADVTPFVRKDQGITLSHGRQDSVSEIQAGQAQFYAQNDLGWFTAQSGGSAWANSGGQVTLGCRVQVNEADQAGLWSTRFDGQIADISYVIDPAANTNLASVQCSDVMAYLNRQPTMPCWTRLAVAQSGPALHWTLNDTNSSATNSGLAAETSGNNGPPLRAIDSLRSGGAAVTWNSTTAGVETLADAASPSGPDMSEFWPVGSNVSTGVNALDSGTAGPFSTPLANVYLKPALTSQSGQNLFLGNTGFTLTGNLSHAQTIAPTAAGADYSIEFWYCMDPAIGASVSRNYGPYIVLGLGSSRAESCLGAGIYLNSSQLLFEVATYAQPPAFNLYDWSGAPVPLHSVTQVMATDTAPLPHHVVLVITGSATAPTLELWVDGQDAGSVALPAGQIYDSVNAGGMFGGTGCFYGSISLLSVYTRQLTNAEIQAHCNTGQYGMWESPTDDCIAAIAQGAQIPPFWNGLSAQHNGLSLTEYLSITNFTPLSAMQSYEQAERGLLYVNSAGMLTFDTRDQRMGHGAPDLVLPPDVYTADLGYQLIDQYLLNTATISTGVFTQGATWVSQSSVNQYGTYSNGQVTTTYAAATGTTSAAAPVVQQTTAGVSLPLITWSRAYGKLGLAPYFYWADPNLNDNAAWLVNTSSTPRLIYGTLMLDLLTLDPLSGITVAQLLALDVDSMIGLQTPIAPSLANGGPTGVFELFIEGMQEVISVDKHQLVLYTSQAAPQRAWIPGDPAYGVLGSTTRVGVSQCDLSVTPALGKDVSHDAGGPYWPPAFIQQSGVYQVGAGDGTGTTVAFSPAIGLAQSYQGDSLLMVVLAPAAAVVTVTDTQANSYAQIASQNVTGGWQYVFAAYQASPVSSADTITVTASVSQAYDARLYGLENVTGADQPPVYSTGTGTTPMASFGALTAANDLEVVLFLNNSGQYINSGWDFAGNGTTGSLENNIYYLQGTSTTGDSVTGSIPSSAAWGTTALSFALAPVTLNNPAGNGRQFVGSLEMRGLASSLQTALTPPLAVIGQQNHQQSFPNGVNGAPQMNWDFIFADTAGGMSLMPSWANWWVCTVPGFYDINGSVPYSIHASGETGTRSGWIVVASAAAQALAAGTANPQTVNAYVCPVGEQRAPNNDALNTTMNPACRVYLGMGDMITIASEQSQGTSELTATNFNGALMSLVWSGNSTQHDQVQVNTSLGGPGSSGGGGGGGGGGHVHTRTWAATHTYSYYGTSSGWTPQLRATDGNVWQGTAGATGTGSQFGFVVFPWAAIEAALTGATIVSARLQATNVHTWYNSGGYLLMGWSSRTSFGSSCTPGASEHFGTQTAWWREGQTRTISLNKYWLAQRIASASATSLFVGDNRLSSLQYYGYWGSPGSWKLTVTYKI